MGTPLVASRDERFAHGRETYREEGGMIAKLNTFLIVRLLIVTFAVFLVAAVLSPRVFGPSHLPDPR
jgi:hypothetical protein